MRSDALNVDARNIEELNYKLSNILCSMNTKYSLEPNILHTPDNNEKFIFDIVIFFRKWELEEGWSGYCC